MGYAFYTLPNGREAGYDVPDTCNLDGCNEQIDRGMAYLCGEEPGGDEYGCGGYFCYGHLFYAYPPDGKPQRCPACIAKDDDADGGVR
ncbi:hypothetical protein [Polymorphospora lycopeni]|uniref:Uncharacterized protein n=1 Tax=Polymorphospora lycopeni TaxID=3140240 RepID=A0ABV5CP40_9ACTN